MKRQLFTFALLLFFVVVSNAQTWAPTGAKWYYEAASGGSLQLVVIESIGDTTINSQLCKILLTSEIESYEDSIGHFYWDTLTCPLQYTYADSGKVYIYDQTRNNFYLLYNFSAIGGDTITVKDSTFTGYCPDGGSASLFQYVVDSLKNAFISGLPLHEQYVSQPPLADWGFSFYDNYPIIENIGSAFYLFGVYKINFLEGVPYCLRCYMDSVLSYHGPNDTLPCGYLPPLGVSEMTMGVNNIKLFPNPVTNQLIIQTTSLHSNEAVTVSIINVLGQVALSHSLPFGEGRGEADVSNLPSGIYFVQLTTAHDRWVGRFVKSASTN